METRQGQRKEAAGATPLSGEGVGQTGLPSVVAFTPFVFDNEKVYALIETDMTPWAASHAGTQFTPESYVGLRRYQFIGVNRGDRIALWVHDMGPAESFDFGALEVLSLWEETVAEVQDTANDIREKDAAFNRNVILARQQELKELWPEMAYKQSELLRLNLRNQSVFGPAVVAERNAFVRKG